MKKKDPTLNNQQLGNLLERYKRVLKPPQASVEKECVQVIKDLLGVELALSQVSYTVHSKTIYIKAPSVLRSELSRSYPLILRELKARLGEGSSPQTIL
jgi:hypothetical protein